MREVIELFPVPLYRNNVFVDEDTRRFVMNCKYERNDNGLFTDAKLLDLPELSDLKQLILKEVEYYVYDYLKVVKDVEVYITSSWAVKHQRGDWAQPHHHSNSIFSGVLYVNVDEKSGNIKFVRDSRAYNVWPISVCPDVEEENRISSVDWVVTPKINDILIFPSHLTHEVSRNLSGIERCVIAFNIFFKGTLGDTETLLILNGE
jgi:uncharacterized protein (TIGR02466 family)